MGQSLRDVSLGLCTEREVTSKRQEGKGRREVGSIEVRDYVPPLTSQLICTGRVQVKDTGRPMDLESSRGPTCFSTLSRRDIVHVTKLSLGQTNSTEISYYSLPDYKV